MRKSVVIILAVAIIGALGVVSRHHGDGASLNSPSGGSSSGSGGSAVQSANTGSSGSATQTAYKDGTYSGPSENTPYGIVQVAAVISGGKITDVKFLQMPSDRGHTQEVTAFAEPYLKDETIRKQSANIDFVSGASTTSEAYQQSLQAALDQAA